MKMRKCLAILLVALIIGQTPAYAVQYGEITQTADMTVRGKGADVAASQINETFNTTVEQNSSVETLNTVTELNTAGNNNSVTSTNNQTTVRENMGTQNSTKNTSGIVMQTRAYTCGPAALATVLQNMGINATEGGLKVLAGTDTSGTTMYGLARAAQSKGLSAAGIELSVDDLKPNHIVHVVIDGTPHFSVVREITETSVKLADPKLGNIEMTRERFSEIFTGHALVISNPNNLTQVNGTDQTNQSTEDTESEDTESGELEKLASEDMQDIQGRVKKLLPAAFVATIKIAANNAVSIAKNAVKRVGERAAIKKARQAAKNALYVWRHIVPWWVRGALAGLTQYLDGTPWYRWCSWKLTRAMIIGAIFLA